jgi:hypothetical protein
MVSWRARQDTSQAGLSSLVAPVPACTWQWCLAWGCVRATRLGPTLGDAVRAPQDELHGWCEGACQTTIAANRPSMPPGPAGFLSTPGAHCCRARTARVALTLQSRARARGTSLGGSESSVSLPEHLRNAGHDYTREHKTRRAHRKGQCLACRPHPRRQTPLKTRDAQAASGTARAEALRAACAKLHVIKRVVPHPVSLR